MTPCSFLLVPVIRKQQLSGDEEILTGGGVTPAETERERDHIYIYMNGGGVLAAVLS